MASARPKPYIPPSAPAMLLAAMRRHGVECLEIEWRVGRWNSGSFSPGIKETEWLAVCAYLDKAGFVFEELHTVEYITPSGARLVCEQRQHLQSQQQQQQQPQEHQKWEKPASPVYWLQKTRLGNFDVPALSARIAISTETFSAHHQHRGSSLSTPPTPPTPPAGSLKRTKKRRSYACEAWSVDLTQVTEGDIDCDKVVYELEVELRDRDMLFVMTAAQILEYGTQTLADLREAANLGAV